MPQVNINELLNSMDAYIKRASKDASDLYTRKGIMISMFDEKIKTDLTPGMCEGIYRGLILDLLEKRVVAGSRHGLFVAIIPVQCDHNLPDGAVPVKFRLGIVFSE